MPKTLPSPYLIVVIVVVGVDLYLLCFIFIFFWLQSAHSKSILIKGNVIYPRTF